MDRVLRGEYRVLQGEASALTAEISASAEISDVNMLEDALISQRLV